MITTVVIGLAAIVVAGLAWVLRRAGKDAVRAETAEAVVKAGERIAESQSGRVDSLERLRDELRDSSGGKL